jgi:hypothetical protein
MNCAANVNKKQSEEKFFLFNPKAAPHCGQG